MSDRLDRLLMFEQTLKETEQSINRPLSPREIQKKHAYVVEKAFAPYRTRESA